FAGAADVERVGRGLAARLPGRLSPLARLAFNYRWAWHPDGPALFRELDAARFERDRENPLRLLQEVSAEALHQAAADDAYVARVRGEDDRPLTVAVPIHGRDVVAQIWRIDVGRVPLYLLDSFRPENTVVDRWITSRLYVGDREIRLAQYALLGRGGVRALRT